MREWAYKCCNDPQIWNSPPPDYKKTPSGEGQI